MWRHSRRCSVATRSGHAPALSIVTIEARHASVIGLISQHSESGISPNGAFDKPYGASRVLADVTSLNYIAG